MRALARGRRAELGAMSLELVIIVPVLLSVLVLLLAYGRQAQVGGLLETAARDGARAATRARSYADAGTVAKTVVDQTLASAPASCRSTAQVQVLPGAADFQAGRDITVQVSCERNLAEIGLPVPSVTMTRSFTSPLDPYRGVRSG